MTTDPEVLVILATFQRPALLRQAIPPLIEQVRGLRGATGRMVVVDNDPAGVSQEVVAEFSCPELQYVHEPRPGIAAARNRGFDSVLGEDVVVFIDDDETPDEGWLQHLVDRWQEWRCAAVAGPVTSHFAGPVDEWVHASRLFERAQRPTGSVRRGASSANLLLDVAVLRRHGLRFDEEFGLTGGSDTMLCHSLRFHGEEIRWCQEAGVTEFVPASRTEREWIVKRTMRTSNTWSRVGLKLAGQRGDLARTRMNYTFRGGYRVARGLAYRARSRAHNDAQLDARGAVDVASGIGLLMGTFGMVRSEYARR